MLSVLPPIERAPGFAAAKVRCNLCCLKEFCAPGEMLPEDVRFLQTFVRKQELRLKPGEAPYQQGDEFRALFAVHTGSFKMVSAARVTGFALSGDMMGLGGIDAGQFTDQAIALEESGVCLLPWDRVEEAAIRIPMVRRQLMRMLSREIRREQEASVVLGRFTAEERLSAFLLALSRRYQSRGFDGTAFRMPMSREDIGSFLGLTPETVSRLFTRLRNDGLVRVRARHLEIPGIERLRALVDALHAQPAPKN